MSSIPVPYPPGPAEIASNAQAVQALTHALRVLSDPNRGWVRKFMLCDDPTADLTILTSPVQNAHSCNFSTCMSCTAASGNELSYTVRNDYFLVPSFSVDDCTVGLASLHQVYRSPSEESNAEVYPTKIYEEYSTGRFYLNNKTGELLLLLSLFAPEVDTLLDLLGFVVCNRIGVYPKFTDREKSRKRMRVEWCLQNPSPKDEGSALNFREYIWALCDSELLLRGRYQDCLYVCDFSASSCRIACGNCMQRTLDTGSPIAMGHSETNFCSCSTSYACPESPLDFTKFIPNIRKMQGSFLKTLEVVICFRGAGIFLAFALITTMSVSVEHTSKDVGGLKEKTITCALSLSKVHRPVPQAEQLYFRCPNLTDDVLRKRDHFREQSWMSSGVRIAVGDESEPAFFGAVLNNSDENAVCVTDPSDNINFMSQQLDLDRDEYHARMELRRQKNRAAAARSNARRKEERENLQRLLDDAKLRLTQLQDREKSLIRENVKLRYSARERGVIEYFSFNS